MAQNRPYRGGLMAAEVMAFLTALVRDRHLDGDIVAVAAAHLPEAMAAALAEPALPAGA
jgi:HD-GYP domain-containing protein (c-di-GMP phosphodiesterase class II)